MNHGIRSAYLGYHIDIYPENKQSLGGWTSSFIIEEKGVTISRGKLTEPLRGRKKALEEALNEARTKVIEEFRRKLERLNAGAAGKVTIKNPEVIYQEIENEKWNWSLEWLTDKNESAKLVVSEYFFTSKEDAEMDFKNTEAELKAIPIKVIRR